MRLPRPSSAICRSLRDVRVNYAATQPQLSLQIDRERASALGVPLDGLDTVLRALVDSTEVADLNVNDRTVPVVLQSTARGLHRSARPVAAQRARERPAAGAAVAVCEL